MQLDWDDLKYVLALHRAGTVADCARALGVATTTVMRRIKHLEQALGARLFQRDFRGRHVLTEVGLGILGSIETMEQAVGALVDRLGQTAGKLTGTVRISSVPFIVNHILMPAVPALRRQHPELQIELMPDARTLDLTKREADLAVRFARPSQGGLALVGRRLGALSFAPFCAETETGEATNWIGYDEANASLPQARWTEALRLRHKGGWSQMRITDLDTAYQGACAGLGIAVLPVAQALHDNRLRQVDLPDLPKMARDVWLVSHVSQRERRAVTAAKTWLAGLDWN